MSHLISGFQKKLNKARRFAFKIIKIWGRADSGVFLMKTPSGCTEFPRLVFEEIHPIFLLFFQKSLLALLKCFFGNHFFNVIQEQLFKTILFEKFFLLVKTSLFENFFVCKNKSVSPPHKIVF